MCPNSFIKFNSNGDYLTEKFLDKLVEAGLNEVFITLHTPKGQVYSDENRSLAFKKFFEKLSWIIHLTICILNEKIGSASYYKGMRLLVESHNWARVGNDRGGIIESLSCKKTDLALRKTNKRSYNSS